MPDAFFTNSTRKRKRSQSVSGRGSKTPGKFSSNRDSAKRPKQINGASKRKPRDEELSDQTDNDEGGIDDMELRVDDLDQGPSGDEEENETPAQKRLRLAQIYLDSVKSGLAEGEFDAADIDRDLISARLKQDVSEHSGKVHLFIADAFDFTKKQPPLLRTRGHRFSVTSAVASESGKFLFTSGKEGSIIKWDLATGKRLSTIQKIRPSSTDKKGKGKATLPDVKGHTDEVLALALSGDEKLLVSSGRDRRVCVWDQETCEWVKTFSGHLAHKDTVGNVAFRKGTNQLYSGSFDRTIKVYDLSPNVMGYVETLFGHQDHVLGLDALRGETCVSVGARDKTARYWKIVDETQLVFRGGGRSRVREVLEGGLGGDDDDDIEMDGPSTKAHPKSREGKKFIEGSVECVAMIDEATFLSGGDSGSICLWNTLKKKPIFTQPIAHGLNEAQSESEGVIQTPRWITALASLRYSDLFASGSWDGDVRIWKLDAKLKSFSLVGTIPAPGVVNSLQLLTPPKGLVESATWAQKADSAESALAPAKQKGLTVNPILLVAGLGQEHRLGRWLTVKEGGATNGAMVVAFSPRTLC